MSQDDMSGSKPPASTSAQDIHANPSLSSNLPIGVADTTQTSIAEIYRRIDEKVKKFPRLAPKPSKRGWQFWRKKPRETITGFVLGRRGDVFQRGDVHLAEMMESVVDVLTALSPDETASNDIIIQIRYKLYGTPPSKHIYKLFGFGFGSLLMYSLAILPIVILKLLGPQVVAWDYMLLLTGFCGLIGSVAGLARNIENSRQASDAGPEDFLPYFFKPFTGVFFGMLSYIVIKADILPIRPSSDAIAPWLYAVLAIAAGFGEEATTKLYGYVQRTMPGDRGRSP